MSRLDTIIEELEEERDNALDKCNGYDFYAGRVNALDQALELIYSATSDPSVPPPP